MKYLKFSEQPVFLAGDTFSFVYREDDCGLVVLHNSEWGKKTRKREKEIERGEIWVCLTLKFGFQDAPNVWDIGNVGQESCKVGQPAWATQQMSTHTQDWINMMKERERERAYLVLCGLLNHKKMGTTLFGQNTFKQGMLLMMMVSAIVLLSWERS
jgi:hypothetical protein